ncbi:MAG: hypothetical protein ACI8WB_003618 [Phenylobacterium sp.]|jgi:hypothetical protein
MKHFASQSFWSAYNSLSPSNQRVADKCYELLKSNPKHPSLHFKNVGKYWSVRAGIHQRALAIKLEDGFLWFWIGNHSVYDKLIKA